MKTKTNARKKKEMIYLCNLSRPEVGLVYLKFQRENTLKKILCLSQPIGSCLVQKFCLNSSKGIDPREEGMETDSETMGAYFPKSKPNQVTS